MTNQFLWRGLQPGVSSGAQAIEVLGAPERVLPSCSFAGMSALLERSWYAHAVTAYSTAPDTLFLLIIAGFADKPDLPGQLAPWMQRFGKPAGVFKSSTAKNAREYVYPNLGVVVVGEGQNVDSIRLFPICNLQTYQERLYIAPRAFRK